MFTLSYFFKISPFLKNNQCNKILILSSTKFQKIFFKVFVTVGCYASKSWYWDDVFVEKLTESKCLSAAASYSLDSKYCTSTNGRYPGVGSSSIMTVDKCLQICTSYAFKYAGIGT